MRVLQEYADPRMKISIFSFNEKWIVKTEAGLCEQTFKFPHEEKSLDEVKAICLSEDFRAGVHARFLQMHENWPTTLR